MVSGTAIVPPGFGMAPGWTVTVIFAGVLPEDGETATPGWELETVKSVALLPGSEIVKVAVSALRLQKFVCTRTSSEEVAIRGNLFRRPSGRTLTPLSEIAYM